MNTNGCYVICTVMFIYIVYVYLKGKKHIKNILFTFTLFYFKYPELKLHVYF